MSGGAVAEVSTRAPVQPGLTDRIALAIEGAEPDAGLTHRELARIAYGVEEPTVPQLSAVRRSVARLITDGRAARGRERHAPYGQRGRGGREVHRPLTASEQHAKDQRREAAARWFVERREAERRATPYPVDSGSGGTVEVSVEPVLVITDQGVELREVETA
jgi:hypothetical protein